MNAMSKGMYVVRKCMEENFEHENWQRDDKTNG